VPIITVIAGVPISLEKDFGAKVGNALKDRAADVVWTPLPAGAKTYQPDYLDRLYEKFVDRLRSWESNSAESVCAVVFYVGNGVGAGSPLRKLFFPEVPVIELEPVNFGVGPATTGNVVGSATNDLLKRIERKLRQVQPMLGAVQKEVTSRVNKTPVLLPPEHFFAEGLPPLLEALETQMLAQADPHQAMAQVLKPFEAKYRKSISDAAATHFVNSRSIAFKRPHGDLHGRLWETDQRHPARCFASARLRLGAGYNKHFHYDCVHVRGPQSLPADWSGCHQQSFKLDSSRKHINIAPNGACR
jgi:hypothetical protein